MAKLTAAGLKSKYQGVFADNITREITESDLRDFANDVADSFITDAAVPPSAAFASITGQPMDNANLVAWGSGLVSTIRGGIVPEYNTLQKLYEYITNNTQGALIWDAVPVNGSQNPVRSDGIFDALSGKANAIHTHAIADVNGLQAELDASSGGAWGAITGVIDDQTDLVNFVTDAVYDAVIGLYDDRGNFDASVNAFPAAGGSGAAGAILKGDIWTVTVAGTLGGTPVVVGQTVRALIDAPGQTAGNWALSAGGSGASTAAQVSFSPSGGIAATTVQDALVELDTEKQTLLVSGTTIKTINGSPVLGAGDLVISGGGTTATQTEVEASADATVETDALNTVNVSPRGLLWWWNRIVTVLFNFSALTFGATVTLNLAGKKKVNRTLTVTGTSFTLDVTNATDGCEIDIKCKFSGVTSTLITLAGAGLTHVDSGVIISALYYSDVDGGEFRLTAKVEGTKVDWITGPGNVVQLLSASTSDIPSVGLVNDEFLKRYKSGGNAFGAAASLGLTDNFTFTVLQNNTEAASFTSTTARFRGKSLFGSTTGTAHSNQQSAGSVGRFVRSITAARTLDDTDNHILANGTFTVTLPTAVGVQGRVYNIKNTGTGTITIATTSAQTIDGVTTRTLSTQYIWIEIISDNANWQIIG